MLIPAEVLQIRNAYVATLDQAGVSSPSRNCKGITQTCSSLQLIETFTSGNYLSKIFSSHCFKLYARFNGVYIYSNIYINKIIHVYRYHALLALSLHLIDYTLLVCSLTANRLSVSLRSDSLHGTGSTCNISLST